MPTRHDLVHSRRSGLPVVTTNVLARTAALASIVVLAGTACAAPTANAEPAPAAPATPAAPAAEASPAAQPLKPQLDEIRNQFSSRMEKDVVAVHQAGIDAVAASGVLGRAKQVGDVAPGFTLPNATGESVSLASLLEQGPVVLVWYRGGWCPYCNATLRGFQGILGDLRAAGATLVAISPETPDKSLSTQQKNELGFTVLSDANNDVARTYGTVFSLTGPVHEAYNGWFQFDQWNGYEAGKGTGELPLAATYVIDRSGVIRSAFLNADYRERAEPADVLAAVRALPSQ